MSYGNGRFGVASFWRKAIHSAIMALYAPTCIHKLVMTILVFTVMPVGTIASVLSYAGLQLQMSVVCTGIGLLLLPSLSCELLGTWKPTLLEIASRLGRPTRLPWSHVSCSVQVVFTTVGGILSALAFPLLSLVFPTTPIFLFASLKYAGLCCLNGHWIGNIIMGIGCFLFDFSVYAAGILVVAFSVQVIVSKVGFLKVFLHELR